MFDRLVRTRWYSKNRTNTIGWLVWGEKEEERKGLQKKGHRSEHVLAVLSADIAHEGGLGVKRPTAAARLRRFSWAIAGITVF
ncbi:hypothetical protein I7I51_02898 [Histoplasma capsulatum]|uniref:Uncharacterized protein n=1 Tax=Ajellomyces capsulatus TaxID=5037 RepID=A0A8A1MLH9_AJECA|nr:hypothetical protein I7I51_02898 [Histoplasma capsulatum]